MDEVKMKKLVRKVKQQESLLQSLFLISSDFKNVRNGKTNSRRRVFNILILVYLAIEMTKVSVWLFLPAEHPFSIFTGSYMMILKRAGKLLYIAIITCTFYTFVSRLGILRQEEKKEMDFMLLPLEFIQSFAKTRGRMRLYNKHELRFSTQFSAMYDMSQMERKLGIFTTNTFVILTCIQDSIKTGQPLSFIFGFFSHLFQSSLFACGNAITSFHWKTCLCFLDMKMAQLMDRLDSIILHGNTMRPKALETVIVFTMKEIESYQELVLKFDKTLKIFLFAAIAATTPVTTTIIHSVIFQSDEQGLILNIILVPITFIFSFQGWSPCYLTTNIFAVSRVIHARLNSIQVRYSEKLSQKIRFQIRKQIKALGNERKPIISLYTLENEAYTPHKFFLYLESCLLTFLLMIDMLSQSGKTAFKISNT